MKWQEGLAIAGALSNHPGISKASQIPLTQQNKRKDRAAAKEGAAIWRSWTSESGNVNDND